MDSNICRLAEFSLVIDKGATPDIYLTLDNIEQAKYPEIVLRLKMTAKYNSSQGYVEVDHQVLDEQGHVVSAFTKAMKELVGSVFLPAFRDPSKQIKLQNNSLLGDNLGNLGKWKVSVFEEFNKTMTPLTNSLSATLAKPVCDLVTKNTSHITSNANLKLSLGEVNYSDILRQIELCQVDGDGIVIPLAKQGRGIQNIVSIILGISGKMASRSNSVLLMEEVEQNLEPPLQRNVIKLARQLTKDTTQFILTTH